MDKNDAFGLEFLDLSGVDDSEKQWVLSSLCSNRTDKTFPWFIGDEKSYTKGVQEKTKPSVKPVPYEENVSSTVSEQPLTNQHNPSHCNFPESNHFSNHIPMSLNHMPIVNNVLPVASNTQVPMGTQYYRAQFIQPVATVVYTNYPTYSVKSPVYYGVPPTQQIFVSQTNTCMTPITQQQFFTPPQADIGYSNVNGDAIEAEYVAADDYVESTEYVDDQNLVNGDFKSEHIDQVPEEVNNQYDVNKIDENNVNTVSNDAELGENVANGNYKESSGKVVDFSQNPEEILEENNDNVAKPSPWGGTKSWASLFAANTPKKDNIAPPTMNGTIQSPVSEAVKKDEVEKSCPFKNPKKDSFIDPDCYRMGEFLSSYPIDGRTFSLQPRGLINQSNYCYINSILQALIACPPMYNLLSELSKHITSNEKRKKTPVIDGMCKFVKEFNTLPANMRVSNRKNNNSNNSKKDQGTINTDVPLEPAWIYKMLNRIRTDLIEGRQEDAEEFLCCLLNNLNDEMLELIKLVANEENLEQKIESDQVKTDDEEDREWKVMGPRNKGSVSRKTVFERTPITDIFGGSLKSRIQRAGDNATENTQPFFTLQLNIEKVQTVKEALEALTTKYQLEGLTSSKTNEQVEAWQQVMLDKLPMILVLHLKCFDFKLDGCTKIIKALEFPIDLKIDAKLLSSAKVADQKQKQYKLFAVVYHDGKEATKGHYVTDAFHVGYSSWLRYDDASVRQVPEEQVLKPQGTRVPYLLFYRRSDTIRSR